ncbi:MAG: hypothetical protein EA360_08925 [Balneolaceae bacterium]|nr:MAG: hypothetical protein EA360_08925 [Balneolaceae bacterium]
MTKTLLFLLQPLFLTFVFQHSVLHAQHSETDLHSYIGKNVVIILEDDSRFAGEVLSVGNNELEIRTEAGRVFIDLDRIRSIREADLSRKDTLWFEDPNRSRLFFAPTAVPLEKGRGYYQNIYIFFNNAAYAVTDQVALTAGFSLFPFLSLNDQLFYFSGKYGREVSSNHYLAAGLGIGGADSFRSHLLTGYAIYTRTFSRAGLSGGGLLFRTHSGNVDFALNTGGHYRVRERISLVTENYFYTERHLGSTVVSSYGIRFMGQRISADLAFIRPLYEGGSDDLFDLSWGLGIPYIDFVFSF